MSDRSPIDALLFDLGNVILEIDFNRVFASWARDADCDIRDIEDRFRFDEDYERHERGEISASEYFASLRRGLGIELTDAQFLAGWNTIFVGEIAGMHALLTRAAGHMPVFAFTNTNAAHHVEWSARFDSICAPIEHIFVSSQMGMRKPEIEAFDAVTTAMGVAPERVLFFDDSAQNVRGARRARLQAIHVTEFADVDTAIRPLLDARD